MPYSANSGTSKIAHAFLWAVIFVVSVASGCNGQGNVPVRTAAHLSDTASGGVPQELVAGPWLAWRGPNRNGVVIDQKPVTTWSETENVLWKTRRLLTSNADGWRGWLQMAGFEY